MALYVARVSFYTSVEAKTYEEAERAINNLLDQLGEVDTDLGWDDCEWDFQVVSEPIKKESN